MKNIKYLTFATFLVFLIIACSNSQKQSQQGISAPTQEEMEKFTEAAEKVSAMLQPKTATLVFILDGTTYRLDTKDVKSTIIPFTHYKPANAEEGEAQESSLIWMQGSDIANGVEITFSINLNEKFSNGSFTAHGGELILSKESKSNYYSVKNMALNIHNFKEKKFRKELSGYSLEMTFSGTIAGLGPKGETHEIKDGKYILKY